jgi:cation:H+ antiporter
MEKFLLDTFQSFPIIALIGVIAVFIFILGKGADILVDEAVSLSAKWGVPKMLIGATIVSIGTTLPEAAVSVFAAVTGDPGLAMGNAVGSIICNTGLILGLSTIISPLPIVKKLVNKQGWIKIGAALLLVAVSIPFTNLGSIFTTGGRVPQFVGFIFIVLLAAYIYYSIKKTKTGVYEFDVVIDTEESRSPIIIVLKLILGVLMVVVSSRIVIPAVQVTAVKLSIPQSIIGATLVAFGTSLPELVTALTSIKKGHGELALGNVIGADILNVLFVAGTATAVTKGGLTVPPNFFIILFPAMIFILLIARIGIVTSGDRLKRPYGVILLLAYIAVTVIGYTQGAIDPM